MRKHGIVSVVIGADKVYCQHIDLQLGGIKDAVAVERPHLCDANVMHEIIKTFAFENGFTRSLLMIAFGTGLCRFLVARMGALPSNENDRGKFIEWIYRKNYISSAEKSAASNVIHSLFLASQTQEENYVAILDLQQLGLQLMDRLSNSGLLVGSILPMAVIYQNSMNKLPQNELGVVYLIIDRDAWHIIHFENTIMRYYKAQAWVAGDSNADTACQMLNCFESVKAYLVNKGKATKVTAVVNCKPAFDGLPLSIREAIDSTFYWDDLFYIKNHRQSPAYPEALYTLIAQEWMKFNATIYS